MQKGLNAALDGSIPARAGEPPTSSTFFRGDGVYPRACGGTRMIKDIIIHIVGRSRKEPFGHGLGGFRHP